MKKIWIPILVIVIIAVAVAIFYKPAEKGTIKIGVLTPLSGSVAELGNNAKNGIDLAAEEINENGGINGQQIQLFYEDSKCDSKEAVSAFDKLANINGVDVILGSICSNEVLSILPLAKQKNILILATAATSPELTGKGIFRLFPSDAYDAEVVADIFYNQWKEKAVSVIYLNNDYGVALKNSFHKKFTSLGGEILNEESYLTTDKDFRTQLTKIASKNPEVIYLISYPVDGGLLAKQIKEMGITAKLLGSAGMKAQDFITKAGGAAEGVFLTSPAEISNEKRTKFLENYKNRFGIDAGYVSDMAYDSLYVLKQATKGTKDLNDIIKNLFKIKDFSGTSGDITFDQNGDRVDMKYNLSVIKNGQFVPYEQ